MFIKNIKLFILSTYLKKLHECLLIRHLLFSLYLLYLICKIEQENISTCNDKNVDSYNIQTYKDLFYRGTIVQQFNSFYHGLSATVQKV